MKRVMRLPALLTVMLLLAHAMAMHDAASAVSPPGAVNYTALGDSVTWQTPGYVATYSAYLATDLNAAASTTNLGTPFWSSGDLLNALQSNQTFQSSVASADVITIFIGLNDYQWMHGQYLDPTSPWCPPPKVNCMQRTVDTFAANWTQIVAKIKTLNGRPNTAIRALTIYNPFVAADTAQGNFTYFAPYLDQMNAVIASSKSAGILVADTHAVFNGPKGDKDATALGFFTAPDVLHPNASGHLAIANNLRALGYAELGQVQCAEDLDRNGEVSFWDLVTFGTAYGSTPSSTNWNAVADFDDGNDVGFPDLLLIAKHYAQTAAVCAASLP